MIDDRPLPSIRQWLIFTDLDGTLLDHHTYSYAAAGQVLAQLRSLNVPVILNSSKTLAELESLAAELQLASPLIAENGSVICWPDQQRTVTLGAEYEVICQILEHLRHVEGYAFRSFHGWTSQEVAEVTGLSVSAATLAKRRNASEPLLWDDSPERLDVFQQQLEAEGLVLKRGGRFWHVMGQADKVKAMQYLADEYAKQHGNSAFIIALGDGPNDRDMLMAADVAVIVYNPDGISPSLSLNTPQRCIQTQLTGPAGWAEAVSLLLHEAH